MTSKQNEIARRTRRLFSFCAAKGYPIHIVNSDAFSRKKLDHMAALGAKRTLVPSEAGRTTRKLILDMIEAARRAPTGPIN